MAIGSKIESLRKKYNYTQEKLAEEIGISRQTLSNWESELTSPDLKQASKISKIFKISLDELVDNNIEIDCKNNNKKNIFKYLINKTCYLALDDFFDYDIDYSTPVKVLSVNEDFMKIKYTKNKQKKVKLIDVDLIVTIKVEGDDN